MIRVVAALAIVLAAATAAAQPSALREFEPGPVEAEAPAIEVITFGVGSVIFEKFGHSAICLRYHDPQRLPVCFNYGVTDFEAGAVLVWNFLREQQQFWVEPTSLGSLVAFYSTEDRDILVQTLPLSTGEARAIESRLWSDLEEEHRFYVYDHFADNCTTRIRDMIDDATGGVLRANTEGAYPLTYRELGRRGLASVPALYALADFVLGRQLDEHPTLWEAMFHPDVLRAQLEAKFGAAPRFIHRRTEAPFPTTGPTGRLRMFLVALAFALPLLLAQWRRRAERLALAWAVLYPGLWGLAIWALVALSPIEGVRWNEVVFVLVPLDLALPLLRPAWQRRYAQLRVAGLLLVSALCAIGVLHQPLWIPLATALLPLAVLAFDLPHGLTRRSPTRSPT